MRFLLGPAGSGKTFRCLAEIRAELARSPEGPPLLLIAPKQATFQLERQLLGDGSIQGYTRLYVLPFDRLARFVLEWLRVAPPELLDDEGRVMVLRALLAQQQSQLKVFRATARLPGFAQQLSQVLQELQQSRIGAERLFRLTEQNFAVPQLKEKLHDIALVLRAYGEWLKGRGLKDQNHLLDLAAETLRGFASRSKESAGEPLRFAGVWLDGFAEMTPQELNLLAALAPFCERATLAFCLEGQPEDAENGASWLSLWSTVNQTFRNCAHQLRAAGCGLNIETLARGKTRFDGSPALAHLERHWSEAAPFAGDAAEALRMVTCANPEAEAVVAAREIRRHVRNGGRYRDVAVLLRRFEGYQEAIQRVFARYGIPCFVDRREPVGHHPLAELTRCAVRLAVFDWQHEDWFGALKSGLVHADETDIDLLETEALAHGWQGETWFKPLQLPGEKDPSRARKLEAIRKRVVPTFQRFAQRLAVDGDSPGGRQLGAALEQLWKELGVEATLEKWAKAEEARGGLAAPVSVHHTVWEQMNTWRENVEMAFGDEPAPVREWVHILEAGLSGLTVGVVPPALDQVLIGTVDRSRNPDLLVAIVLGMNETVFPAPPPRAAVLTEADRGALEKENVVLNLSVRQRLAHERFYGYIACTRARRRLVLTCSATDAKGTALNPSPFLLHIERLFPGVKREVFSVEALAQQPGDVEHASELIGSVLRDAAQPPAQRVAALDPLLGLKDFAGPVAKWRAFHEAMQVRRLRPESSRKLYGNELHTSVSGLEDFAACAFKFLVKRGLKAEERQEFEADVRERGTFQHEILYEFHQRLRAAGRRWHDLAADEACALIEEIGREVMGTYREGMFQADEERRFTARQLIGNLQRLVRVLIGWMRQYEFEPHAVELGFGMPDGALPGWRLKLDEQRELILRGYIDRIDLLRLPGTDEALAVVMDYKSSTKALNALKVHNGLQLQLLSYLGVLRHLEYPQAEFGVSKLVPAGVFFVNLRRDRVSGGNRVDVMENREAKMQESYKHRGRFNVQWLRHFDNRGEKKGDQFAYEFKKNSPEPKKRGHEALEPDEFRALMDEVEGHLRRIGREVFSGNIEVFPYRLKNETACGQCEFLGICRFDAWVDAFRKLQEPKKE
ncbi:MAG: PD-(D/E)XK nuclease family protein [Verrucomicrobiota bacterium]